MYTIQVHRRINNVMKLFQRVGVWHSGDQATAKETKIKLFYSIHLLLFFISLIVGAFSCDNRDESIYLTVSAVIMSVLCLRLLYIVWKKNEIVELLDQIGVHSIEDQEKFTIVNEKLETFTKFAFCFSRNYLCRRLMLRYRYTSNWK